MSRLEDAAIVFVASIATSAIVGDELRGVRKASARKATLAARTVPAPFAACLSRSWRCELLSLRKVNVNARSVT